MATSSYGSRPRRSRRCARLACLAVTALCLATSRAGANPLAAEGDLITGLVAAVQRAPGATYDLCVFSERTLPAPAIGPNNTSFERDLLQNPPAIVTDPLPACDGRITIGRQVYNPLVGFRGRAKPAGRDARDVTSASGGFLGRAGQIIPVAGGAVNLIATGERSPAVPAGAVGRAAGQAVDPFQLDPGSYDYAPTVAFLLETDEPTDFAGVSFFATDSRFTDPLWSLQITADGLIDSIDDLEISFSTSSALSLDPAAVLASLIGTIVVSGGTATLDDYLLFSTVYTVDQTTTFAEGVGAGVAAVPEPSSMVLAGLATVGLVAGRRLRPRRRA